MRLAQELLTNVQCSGGSRSFAKEKLEECSGWPSEFDNSRLRAIIEDDPLKATREVAKELNVNHSSVVQHLKKLRKVKKLSKRVPHELTTNLKKIVVLKYRLLFFYATTMNYFSIRLGRATKSGFYTTTSSVVGP